MGIAKSSLQSDEIQSSTQIRDQVEKYRSESDPEILLAETNTSVKKEFANGFIFSTDAFKAVSMNEFANGVLMIEAMPEKYRTFAIETLRTLIKDYNCQTVGEKTTAELATISFVETFDLRERITDLRNRLDGLFFAHRPHPKDSFYGELSNRCTACERSKTLLKLNATFSKELDQAYRHYFEAIQTLRLMKQVPLQFNINTNIGQNQVIQTKNG